MSSLPVSLALAGLPIPSPFVGDLRHVLGAWRAISLEIWGRVCQDRRHAGLILPLALRERGRVLGSRGRRFVADLLYGFIRCEALLDRFCDDPEDRYFMWLILACGMDPADLGVSGLPSLSDARERIAGRARDLDPGAAMALGASLPDFVAREWAKILGTEAPDLVLALAGRAPLVIRANAARIDRESLALRLSEEGIPSRPTPHASHGLVLEERANVQVLSSFREGLLEVQDEGSQMVADLVAPVPGMKVVDFCAGAGGKSLALASLGARVWALDLRDLRELERRAGRAGLRIRTSRIGPTGPLPLSAGEADTVLVDAPCSGSGVLRRHPETRWRLDEARVAACAREQAGVLARAASLVRPRGRLVYATCSLLESENQGVVEDFLARNNGFSVVDRLGGRDGLLWPHRTGTDGFFGVVIERAGSWRPSPSPC